MSRVCLLTGSGGVLGDVFCRVMAHRYAIVAVYRSEPPLVATQDARLFDPIAPRRLVPESQAPVFAVPADLRLPGEVDRVVELTLARFGQVDLLVNAAADVATLTVTTDPDEVAAWENQLWMNTVLPVQVAATVAAAFWQTRGTENRSRNRNVVNVSSMSGLGTRPLEGRGFYAASKAALNLLTARMSCEYARFGVRVNAVAPTSFPMGIPTEQVVDAIGTLDGGTMRGEILVMDAERSYRI